MKKLETIILQNLIQNEKFSRKVGPFLKAEYFQNEDRLLLTSIAQYFQKYNSLPTKDSLQLHIRYREKIDEKIKQKALDLTEKLFEPLDTNQSEQWILDETENWCQYRALALAIYKGVDIIEGRDKKLDRGAIPSLFQDALAVGFDTTIGHDYFMDAGQRYDFYTGKADSLEKIPFLLDYLNGATNGGAETKSLNMIIGGTGGGKSMTLCSFAADYIRQGYDCLYISLEMADMKIAQRIDANLMNVEMNDIQKLGSHMYQRGVANLQSQTKGRLIIKEFPAGTATANHFRNLLDELKIKKNFEPKVILIDYLNLCASSRYKASDVYSYVKGIAEEIRSLAMERNVCIWSATQTNREGFKKSDIDVADTSESFGIPFTADFMISIYADQAMQKQGKMLIKQATKNRYGDVNDETYHRFFVGCNRPKMTLYNLDE